MPGLVIGPLGSRGRPFVITNELRALAGVTSGTRLIPFFDTIGHAVTAPFSAVGEAFLGETTVPGQRDALLLGAAAVAGLSNDPTLAGNSATNAVSEQAAKGYSDAVAQSRKPKDPVQTKTVAALPANTYSAGVLTATANGALPAQDGVTLTLGQSLLVNDEADQTKNGLYTLTQVGTGGLPWKLTRRADADTGPEIVSAYVLVLGGATDPNTQWLNQQAAITLGTTAITFAKIGGGSGVYTGDETTVHLAGTQFSVKSVPLLAIHGITPAAGTFPVFTSTTAATGATITTDALTLLAAGTFAQMRTALSLGSAALHNHTEYDLTGAAAGVQAVTQPLSTKLTNLVNLTWGADLGLTLTGANTVTTYAQTALARTLAGGATQQDMRDTLGLGTVVSLNVDTDGTMAANSTTRVPSQSAVVTYVSNAVTGLLDFKGNTDASANPNYPAASKGDAYVITIAGKVGGAAGVSVDVGDVYFATADNAGGSQASVGASWDVLEHNLAGALLTANALSELAAVAATARTNLGLAALATKATVAAADIDPDAVTYAKIQNVSATDKVLGRATAGAGDVEEIACTAAGRALIDDADAAAQRTTLGLGTLATQNGTFSGTSSGTNTGDQTIPAAANPTATVGPSAVNGSATTFMRSDAAPALANTAVAAGAYGSAVLIPTFTVDAQGRLTAAATVANTGPWSEFQVAGANATTTGQTLVDVAGLVTGTLAVSSVYEFEAVLLVTTSAVTTGIEFGVNVTVAPTNIVAVYTGTVTSTTGGVSGTNANNTAETTAFLTTSAMTGHVKINGMFTTGASGSPVFSIRFLKVTSGTATVLIKSTLRVRKL